MCLLIKIEHPDRVLEEGEHEGFQWVVTHNGLGYRCGYVRIPKDHPWHGGYDESINASVHGGLTFWAPDIPCDDDGDDDAWWLGFDCHHAGDACDPLLPSFLTSEQRRLHQAVLSYGTIKTTNYVRQECEKLCEQAFLAQKTEHA